MLGCSTTDRQQLSQTAQERKRALAQKVIIDADPGIGDAVAIALAVFDPAIDVLAVTATAGCVSCRTATRNVQAIIEFLDPPKWPRLGRAESDVAHSRIRVGEEGLVPALLSGETGLGDFQFNVAELHHLHDSAKLMIDLVRSHPNEVTLLTLGPLTNLAIASERAPEFLSLLNRLVCLGGAVRCGGDVTASAEFNIFADPLAARNVLRSPATKTLVPLDVSARVELTFDQFDRMQSVPTSPLSQMLDQLLPYAFRAHHEHLGFEGIRLNEIAALAAVAQERLFESRSDAVDVETRGELTRGMTVFDRRGVLQWQTNIDVLCDVDAQGVLDYFTRTLRRAAV